MQQFLCRARQKTAAPPVTLLRRPRQKQEPDRVFHPSRPHRSSGAHGPRSWHGAEDQPAKRWGRKRTPKRAPREQEPRAAWSILSQGQNLSLLLKPFQVQFAIGTVSAKDHCNKPLRLRCMVYAAGPSSPRTEVRPVRALPDSGERGADSRSLSSGGTPQSQMRVLAGGLHAVASTRSRRA